eukprot:14341637-Alexandrium_andersonii.AAC.1
MSASLVGSEMCIRDSSHPALANMPFVEGYAAVHLMLTAWVAPLWRDLMPVSYTHLTLPTICSV